MDLEDEYAIARLKNRYCHTIDSGAYDEWVSLYTPEGRFVRPDADPVEGHDELFEMASESFDESFDHTAHTVTNPIIDVDVDEATGKWYLLFVYQTAKGNVGWTQGTYADRFKRIDDEWSIEEVTVEFNISSSD